MLIREIGVIRDWCRKLPLLCRVCPASYPAFVPIFALSIITKKLKI